MNYIVAVLRLLAIVFGFEILFLLMLASGPSLLAESELDNSAAAPLPALSTAHPDTTLKPIPSLFETQQPGPLTDGSISGWSGYKNPLPYDVVDQCLCPPETLVSKPIFNHSPTEDDCSLIGGFAYNGERTH